MPLQRLNELFENQNVAPREALEQACVCIQELLPNANLISLWLFEDNNNQIRSLINYDAENKSFSQDIILTRELYPAYFNSILENEVINASVAREHYATKCFNESYFEPANIYSLLDFILHKDHRPSGVICCERRGDTTTWTEKDIENIRMVATLISYFFDITKA